MGKDDVDGLADVELADKTPTGGLYDGTVSFRAFYIMEGEFEFTYRWRAVECTLQSTQTKSAPAPREKEKVAKPKAAAESEAQKQPKREVPKKPPTKAATKPAK